MHVPACLRAWQGVFESRASETRFDAGVWLALAIVFFVLKLIGVPWLRFQTDRRSLCAIALAILLIHAGPIGFRPPEAVAPGSMPLVGTMLLMMGLSGVQQILKGPASQKSGRASGLPWRGLAPLPAVKCVSYATSLTPYAPRPPPARI
ncbi:MAG TPA: hypothetical protein VMV94_11385 [Phycisphaerae bacterium]|nr:hypothetical protein [Phycisphaerae bacterium]